MKKIILSIAAVAALAVTSQAQEKNETDFREQIQIGVKAGANFSNVYSRKGENFEANPRIGLAAGGFVSIPIGKYLGLQPELLFSQKGFNGKGKILNGNYEFTRTTNYIDVPLLVALKPSEFITLLAGPQYSYLISQRDVFKNATTSIEQEQEFENDDLRKNTFCFTGGADINMKHIVLGVRAGWDLLNNNGDGTTATPRYKNVWGQVTVGYKF